MTGLRYFGLIPALVVALTIGCIKRSEKITIFEDGRTRLETEIVGGPDDVYIGDAMPTAESGWQVKDEIETKDDGDKELTRTATREIAAGAPIPASYAAPHSRLDLIALQFPTTLEIEHRSDGTYYHFKRVYTRRPFAMVQYWKDKVMESDEIKAITQKEPEDVTTQERRTLTRAFVDVAARQAGTYMEQIGLEMQADIPQDALLEARRSAMAVFSSDEITNGVMELLHDDRDDEFVARRAEQLEENLRTRVHEAAERALRNSGVRAAVSDEVVERCVLAHDAFEITEDLGDETWLVGVVMPGRIIAHNSSGDPGREFFEELLEPVEQEGVSRQSSISATVRVEKDGRSETVSSVQSYESRNKVAWEFDGQALRDRDVVLMATSFVQNTEE